MQEIFLQLLMSSCSFLLFWKHILVVLCHMCSRNNILIVSQQKMILIYMIVTAPAIIAVAQGTRQLFM